MLKNDLHGCRILLVQSDPLVALKLAEAFAGQGAEVVTTFGLSETFHEIGKSGLDGAVVHLELEDASGCPPLSCCRSSECRNSWLQKTT